MLFKVHGGLYYIPWSNSGVHRFYQKWAKDGKIFPIIFFSRTMNDWNHLRTVKLRQILRASLPLRKGLACIMELKPCIYPSSFKHTHLFNQLVVAIVQTCCLDNNDYVRSQLRGRRRRRRIRWSLKDILKLYIIN